MNEQEIFSAALEQEPNARAAFLDEACGNDSELRSRLQGLVDMHDQAENRFEKVAAEIVTTDHPPHSAPIGESIGPFKLLERVGEGGMGEVYVAEQTEPVRRKVALKVIKPGMDTAHVIARFEAERQALAIMNHPNIAKVLDAGATESGRPYFVMELVKGISVTEYCDQHKLDVNQRLEVFVTICQAVQHAHQKGVIHRDLKPSNILVELHDVRAVPKVIDFGVAKATDQQLTNRTLHTGLTQMIGTPTYMSPEQAQLSGLDVDTRSDIFSLGVLLYELLTGTTPLESETLRQADFDEMRRMIREDEPPRPSERVTTMAAGVLSTVSEMRRVDPQYFNRRLKGELDWIVMKSLDKDRARRYESASAFAADVERFLNDEHVEACPPSAGYKLHKFARRNKALLTTSALVFASLAIGTGVATWQAIQAHSSERKAERNAAEAAANYDLAREAVDRLFTKVAEEDLLDQPHMQELRKSLLNDALTFYQRFVAQQDNTLNVSHDTALAYHRLGGVLYDLGRYDEAAKASEKAVSLMRPIHEANPDNTQYAADLVEALLQIGEAQDKFFLAGITHFDPSNAKHYMAEARTVAGRLMQREDDNLNYVYLLAKSHTQEGLNKSSAELAQPDYDAALKLVKRLVDHDPSNPDYRLLFAEVLHYKKGISNTKRALAILENLVDEFPHSREYRSMLGSALNSMSNRMARTEGDTHEEVVRLRERWVASEQQLATNFPSIRDYRGGLAMAHMHLGISCCDLGKHEQAMAQQDKASALLKQLISENSEYDGYPNMLARVYKNKIWHATEARNREALYAISQEYIDFARGRADGHYEGEIILVHIWLAQFHAEAGEEHDARDQYAKAYVLAEKYIERWPVNQYVAGYASEALQGRLRFDDGPVDVASATKVLDFSRAFFSDFKWQRNLISVAYQKLSRFQESTGNILQAIDSLRGSIEVMRRQLQEDEPVNAKTYTLTNIAKANNRIGGLYRKLNDHEGALGAYQTGADTLSRLLESEPRKQAVDDPVQKAYVASQRGIVLCLTELDRHDEALEVLSQAMRTIPDNETLVEARGLLRLDLDQREEGIADLSHGVALARTAVESDPDNREKWDSWNRIALSYYRLQDWQGAEREARAAIEIAADSPNRMKGIVPLLLLAGQDVEYRDVCRNLLARWDKWEGGALGDAALMCTLDPQPDDVDGLLRLVRRAVAEGPDWSKSAEPRALLRVGDYAKGLDLLEATEKVTLDLAIAYHLAQRPDEARQALQQALHDLNERESPYPNERMELEVLRDEAVRLIHGDK